MIVNLLWPLWARNKQNYVAAGVAFFFILVAVHLPQFRAFATGLAFIYAGIGIALMATAVGLKPFGFGPPMLKSAEATFPRAILTLPISTRDLIFIPVSIAFFAFLAIWGIFVTTAIIPLHLGFPIEVPILLCAAYVCMVHACWWLGVWIPGASYFCVVANMYFGLGVAIDLLGGGSGAFSFLTPRVGSTGISWLNEDLICALIAIVSLAALLRTAPYARHQHQAVPNFFRKPTDNAPARISSFKRKGLLPRFRSSMEAQAWFEAAPRFEFVLSFLCMALFGGIAYLPRFMENVSTRSIRIPDEMEPYALLGPWMPWPALFLGPLIIAFSFAINSVPASTGKLRNIDKNPGIDPFLAVRPLACADIVAARLRVVARSAAIAGTVVVTAIALWPLKALGTNGHSESPLTYLISHPSLNNMLFAGFVVVTTLLTLWCVQSGNPFMDILPPFLRHMGRFILIGATFYPNFNLLMGTMLRHEGTGANKHYFLQSGYPGHLRLFILQMTVAGIVLLVTKAGLLVRSLRLIRNRNLIPPKTIRKASVFWVAVALVLVTGFYELLPSRSISLLDLILIVTILLPANRVLLQVIKLDATRHR